MHSVLSFDRPQTKTSFFFFFQECYVHNLLKVTVYIPTMRRDILELTISKMLTLDVSLSVLLTCHHALCLPVTLIPMFWLISDGNK